MRMREVVRRGVAAAVVATLAFVTLGTHAPDASASTPGVGPFDGAMIVNSAVVTGSGEIRFDPVATYQGVDTSVFWAMTAWVSGYTGLTEYTYQPGCADNGDCTPVRIFQDVDGTWVIGYGDGSGPFGCTHDWTFHLEGTYVATLESVKDPGFFYNHAGLAQADFAGPMPSQACPQRPDPSASSTSVTEGNTGAVTATVTVTLSAAPASSYDVSWQTVDGTAIAGSDYTAASGTLTFAPGQTSRTVGVTVTGDRNLETNEAFGVRATNGIWSSTGTVTITNDEPTVSVSSPSVSEGNSGTTVTTVHIALSSALAVNATLSWTATDGTATAPSDFAIGSGTVTFTAGQTDRTFTVTTNGDVIDEADQTVALTVRNADSSVVASGNLTIVDDDAAPALSITSPTVVEGNAGSPNAAEFTVSIDGPTELGVSFDYSLQDITTATDDHAGAAGTVVLHDTMPGTISVRITSDIYFEADETFRLVLTNLVHASGVTPGGGVATILNDDLAPYLSASGVKVTERNGFQTVARVRVSIPSPAGLPITVPFTIVDGTAKLASGDYDQNGNMTADIAVGDTWGTAEVYINGDTTYEGTETLKVVLSNPANARIKALSGRLTATVQIANDDPPPTLTLDAGAVNEGGPGQVPKLTMTAHLSAVSGLSAVVHYATVDGTAIAGSDYSARSGAISIPAGRTTVTISIPIIGDATVEPDETFTVTLSSPARVTLDTSSATATIRNDD